jgi:hypothetical protein
MKHKILLAVTAAAVLLLNGCVIALGNKVPEERAGKGAPTLGRQLTDLKQARDSGALTEEEYQAAKKRVMQTPAAPAPAHH